MMRSMGMGRFTWVLVIVLLTGGMAGAFAQSAPSGGGGEAAKVVGEMGLPAEKATAALALVDGFLGQMQQSGKDLLAFLSPKTPEQLLDPQVSTRIEQLQKSFALKLERFHLDLADIAGEEMATKVAARFKAIVPQVLIGDGKTDPPQHASPAHPAAPAVAAPAAVAQAAPPVTSAPGKPQEVPLGSGGTAALPSLDLQVTGNTGGGASGQMGGMMDMMSSMMSMMGGKGGMASDPNGGMSGMSNAPSAASMPGMNNNAAMGSMPGTGASTAGGAAAPDAALSSQLLSTNALLTQLLSMLSSQPGGITPAQLQTVNQLLANQATLLQLLLKNTGGTAATGATGGAGGMSGMSGM